MTSYAPKYRKDSVFASPSHFRRIDRNDRARILTQPKSWSATPSACVARTALSNNRDEDAARQRRALLLRERYDWQLIGAILVGLAVAGALLFFLR